MIIPKSQLVDAINTELGDNSTGKISPNDIRHNLLDIIDSVHNLLDDTKDITVKNLTASNIATPTERSVRFGENALGKLNLVGYETNDNSAIGYHALKNNYLGSGNTALGSFSLSCNVFGDNNTAIGVNSVSSNTNGFGNVGVGNYTLTRNRVGSFNISIGHAAGYYNRDIGNKLYIASHPVDEKFICDNPLGSGLVPLVFGDLEQGSHVFAINTDTLRSTTVGVLQTSGSISPTMNSMFDLGHSSYYWRDLRSSRTAYLSGISFVNDVIVTDIGSNAIGVSGDLLPFANKHYDLGSSSNYFASGYISHLFTDVTNTVTNNHFTNKTFHLASSGESPQTLMEIEDLRDGGLSLRGSGIGKHVGTDFNMAFRPSGDSVANRYSYAKGSSSEDYNILSSSFFEFNTSIHTTSGSYVNSPRFMNSGELDLVVHRDGQADFGLYLNSGIAYFATDSGNMFGINPGLVAGKIAGIENVNFLAPSGKDTDYFITCGALESGVTVGQRFLTGTKQRSRAGTPLQDKLSGFSLSYIDDSTSVYSGPRTDRFVISSQDDSEYSVNNLILMKNHAGGGMLGLNNFSQGGDTLIPQTAFNIRHNSDVVARITAENDGAKISSLQLLAGANCLNSGLEILYRGQSGVAELNMYSFYGPHTVMRINESGHIGILSSGDLDATYGYLTIGDSGHPDTLVAIHESSDLHQHVAHSGYAKMYAKEIIVGDTQSNSLYLLDSSGNHINLVRNKYVHSDDLVFTDSSRNTFAGDASPTDRFQLVSATHNAAFGYSALSSNGSGDKNSAFGAFAMRDLNRGDGNVGFGYQCGFKAGDFNLAIGHQAGEHSSGNYNIILGTDVRVGDEAISSSVKDSGNYIFKVSPNAQSVFMSGSMGPLSTHKHLFLPSGGKLSIEDGSMTRSLHLSPNLIQVNGNKSLKYPADKLILNFQAGSGSHLVEFSHDVTPMSGVRNSSTAPLYMTPDRDPSTSGTIFDISRPVVSVSGDLELLGSIRFSDDSSLDTSRDMPLIASSGASISGQLDAFKSTSFASFAEGFMVEDVPNPADFGSPTSGLMRVGSYDGVEDENYVFIVNRDVHSSLLIDDYVVAMRGEGLNGEFRPVWISNKDLACNSCCE
jgi:hypothetical protein